MTNASDLRRFAGTVAAALTLTALATGCASGQRPDTGGIDPGRYLARLSGQWVLNRDTSDDPARVLEAHSRDRAHDGGRSGGGGGHGPGRHGGGFGGARPDPAAMEATFDAFRSVPDHFTLAVTESVVVTTWAGQKEARMPVGGDAIPVSVRGPKIEARVKWDGGRLLLERRIEGGGTVVDIVDPLAAGSRLLVIRTVKGLPGTIPEVRLVFDRVR